MDNLIQAIVKGERSEEVVRAYLNKVTEQDFDFFDELLKEVLTSKDTFAEKANNILNTSIECIPEEHYFKLAYFFMITFRSNDNVFTIRETMLKNPNWIKWSNFAMKKNDVEVFDQVIEKISQRQKI